METDLENTFLEEYAGAKEQLEKERYKNAVILFSKALFALCDLLIYQRLKKLPKNHTERFRMLEEFFPEAYQLTDGLFSKYTDAYSKPSFKENAEAIQNGIKHLIATNEVPETLKAAVE